MVVPAPHVVSASPMRHRGRCHPRPDVLSFTELILSPTKKILTKLKINKQRELLLVPNDGAAAVSNALHNGFVRLLSWPPDHQRGLITVPLPRVIPSRRNQPRVHKGGKRRRRDGQHSTPHMLSAGSQNTSEDASTHVFFSPLYYEAQNTTPSQLITQYHDHPCRRMVAPSAAKNMCWHAHPDSAFEQKNGACGKQR